MKDKEVRIVRKHYIDRVLNNEISEYQVLDWESREAQLKRFDTLFKYFNIENNSLLDVGCGLCHLGECIDEKKIKNVDYNAIDIIPEMIERAKEKKFLSIKPTFFVGDMFSNKYFFGNKKFDYIYSSGIFNLNTGSNEIFLNKAIESFVSLTNKGICFNMLDISASQKYGEKYFYYSRNDVVEITKNILSSANREFVIKIENSYLTTDFSIIIIF